MAINWNAGFTQLIRRSRRAHWGNWALSSQIKPGAFGIVDPASGDFRYGGDIPKAPIETQHPSSQWNMMTESVSRQEVEIDLKGRGEKDKTKIMAGLQVEWSLKTRGSMISEFAIGSEEFLSSFGALLKDKYGWLAERAAEMEMARDGVISQGLGVVTSVIYADSGLNVGSQSDSTTISLTGTFNGVREMLRGKGKGSYTSFTANKSVDKHVWPAEADSEATTPVPIAFTIASFHHGMIIPNWTSHISSFRLVLDNAHGGSYIVEAKLTYKIGERQEERRTTVSGGLTSTIADIPLDATNLELSLKFLAILSPDYYTFKWDAPLGQWYDGTRHIDLTGVWPMATGAVDTDAGLRA